MNTENVAESAPVHQVVKRIISFFAKPIGLLYHPNMGYILFDDKNGYACYYQTKWGRWKPFMYALCRSAEAARLKKSQCTMYPPNPSDQRADAQGKQHGN